MQERKYNFHPQALEIFSPQLRQHLEAFAKGLAHAEGVLREYHAHNTAIFTGTFQTPLDHIAENARLIFTLSWSKAILFSRSVIDSVNIGNLLAAFLALRGYAELSATLRYTVNQMKQIITNAVSVGTIPPDQAREISGHMDILLHGGRFNWKTYFEEGVPAVIDRKKLKRTKEDKLKFETNSLRVGKCFEDWGKESPEAEFIYDYLCDIVHPNKGSNMILLVEREHGLAFDVSGTSAMGINLFERIFPYAASMCMGEMVHTQPFFALLGVDAAKTSLFQ